MTIQEAIKSGKRFRRPGIATWLSRDEIWKFGVNFTNDEIISDLLAEDWKIEEFPITITKSEFIMKLAEQMKLDGTKFLGPYGPAWPTDSFGCQYIADHLFEFLERLGFEK